MFGNVCSPRIVGQVFRPPSEAFSLIIQATIGCSWNRCAYCAMYADKPTFSVRKKREILEDVDEIWRQYPKPPFNKVFVSDGVGFVVQSMETMMISAKDALVMDMDHWEALLRQLQHRFPHIRSISTYATARNVLEKSVDDLKKLRAAGLRLLYMGPESGDDETLRVLRKGAKAEDHVKAAQKAKEAGMDVSAIFLLGAGGTQRSQEHAKASAKLASAMDPKFLACLTTTVVEGTYLQKLIDRGQLELPSQRGILEELGSFLKEVQVTDTLFSSNHASNYLPLSGKLPQDREGMLKQLEMGLSGKTNLRPEWLRGL